MTAERTQLIKDIREILAQEFPDVTPWKRDRTTGRLLCQIDHYTAVLGDKTTK